MLEYIHSHQAGFWIALGFILLALEVLVMGFSTLVMFFAGLGAVTTGVLMQFGLIPTGWISGIASFGIFTGAYGVLLWKPFQRIQANSTPQQVQTSDLIGLEFVLEQDISLTQPGSTKYSGITWKVELDRDAGMDSLPSATRVVVCSLDAGIFRVKPV
ncbi:MAG: NfeD family protein [Gammaproteobacteria bacterium]|nr:NfeD family protein [Gammaproteobacteria bacterium]